MFVSLSTGICCDFGQNREPDGDLLYTPVAEPSGHDINERDNLEMEISKLLVFKKKCWLEDSGHLPALGVPRLFSCYPQGECKISSLVLFQYLHACGAMKWFWVLPFGATQKSPQGKAEELLLAILRAALKTSLPPSLGKL